MAVVITCVREGHNTSPEKHLFPASTKIRKNVLAVCLFLSVRFAGFNTRRVRMGQGGIAVGQSSKL
jgi:hypothetical protein